MDKVTAKLINKTRCKTPSGVLPRWPTAGQAIQPRRLRGTISAPIGHPTSRVNPTWPVLKEQSFRRVTKTQSLNLDGYIHASPELMRFQCIDCTTQCLEPRRLYPCKPGAHEISVYQLHMHRLYALCTNPRARPRRSSCVNIQVLTSMVTPHGHTHGLEVQYGKTCPRRPRGTSVLNILNVLTSSVPLTYSRARRFIRVKPAHAPEPSAPQRSQCRSGHHRREATRTCATATR